MREKSKYDAMSDEELVHLFQTGKTEVADYIIMRYHKVIFQCTGNLFLIGGEREDLIQEGRLGLYDALKTYDAQKNDSFEPFARLCIVRAQIKIIEKANRKKNKVLNESISIDQNEESTPFEWIGDDRLTNPEEILLSAIASEELEDTIRQNLSLTEEEVMNYMLEGLKAKDIARIMDKNAKSIDNTITRVRAKAKKIIKEHRL